MTWSVTADVARYDEACDWFLKRVVMTSAQARALDDRLKNEAFWVGGGLQLEQVQRVFDKIGGALEKGTPFEEWRKAVRTELTNDAHAETVFRNAAQRSYNAGRWQQMTEPSVQRFRPFWMFDAVLDTRTTKVICRPRDGTILPADDPWWDQNWAPLHHRCRSSVRNMRRSEAERRGISASGPPDLPPGGWGQSPRNNPPPPKPKSDKHDPALLTGLERKQRSTRPRKARSKKQHEQKFWEPQYKKVYGEASPALAWGRAMQERGLDMPIAEVRKQLARLSDHPSVGRMLHAVRDLPDGSTLREHTGELDAPRKAAAALASHLDKVPVRTQVQHPDLVSSHVGARALRFFSQTTSPAVRHPEDHTFVTIVGRSGYSARLRLVEYNPGRDGALEHEWGHALEALNPVLARRAAAFLEARTKGEPLKQLSGLPLGEVGREDKFLTGYIGRDYGFQATEITSMGVDVLAGDPFWGTLEDMVRNDPEHFWFTLGQLRHP